MTQLHSNRQIPLDRYDFHRYDDPTAQSLYSMERARSTWGQSIKVVRDVVSTHEKFIENERHLLLVQEQYAQALVVAASNLAAITTETSIEELAIPAVEHFIRNEDIRGRSALGRWCSGVSIPTPPDDYFYYLSRSLGDPHGVTMSDDDKLFLLSPEQSVQSISATLDGQSAPILSRARKHQELMRQVGQRSFRRKATSLVFHARKQRTNRATTHQHQDPKEPS